MNRNWLYDLEIKRDNPGLVPEIVVVRSLAVDLDTVCDVAERISIRFSSVPTKFLLQDYAAEAPQPVEVPVDKLAHLSGRDLGRLYIENHSGDQGGMRVELRKGVRPIITMVPNEPDFMDGVARILLDSGKPRVRWSRFIKFLALLPFLTLLALWVWVLATTPVAVPLSVFIWALLVCALALRIFLVRSPKLKFELSYPGHRIRSETRQDTRKRRTDTHANIKVAFITAPISLIVGVAGGLVLAWLTGKH